MIKNLRKLGFVLAFLGIFAFVSHVEHEGHEHSQHLKKHDCICHTVGMISCDAPKAVEHVFTSIGLKVRREVFAAEAAPLFLNPPRAPPAA